MTTTTDLHWKRILAGGIAPHAISITLLIVVIIGYTFLVSFATGGEPDPGSMQQFNTVSGTQLFPIVTILLTVPTAAWVVKRVDSQTAVLHGLAVGILAGLLGLGFGALDLLMVARFGATVLAGVLGAKLAPAFFSE
ncbi:hypothetical protein [Halohasta litorea]|uniref:Uncharacterized protein n=1 Tax=Halohasta litorea TaxID=869891 RepID=A0ABD6DFM8_9EURY|nr:hypothetical protein [Halohasta litorea]